MNPKHLILTLLGLCMIVSCSKDDDSNNGPKGHFPIRILKTDFTNASFNRKFELSYDAQNRISRITATSPDDAIVTYDLIYTHSLLTQILATGEGTSNTVSHEFTYTSSGVLSSYVIADDEDVNTYPIAYFEDTHIYSLIDEGETYTMDFHEENAIAQYSLPFGVIQINSDFDHPGVFQHLEIQPAMHLFFGIFNGMDYYFFNSFEIESVQFLGAIWNVSSTRDSNNNISVLNYMEGATNVREYRIDYQQRNL